jgi:hypothetical protein
VSSIPVLDRADADCADDDWTDVQSPRQPLYTANDVKYAVAAARSRHLRSAPISAEIDLDHQQFGGRDPELAVEIQESVAEFWDR